MERSDTQGRELVLHIEQFDWSKWQRHELEAPDVSIVCLADVARNLQAPIMHALYRLALQVHVKPDWSVEQYVTRFDCWQRVFLAMRDDECVGYTYARARDKPGELQQGMTAVLPPYRRRGIATALKLATIGHARAHGFRRIFTSNSSSRAEMIQLNLKLGYIDQ